jgi:hypothetical protein
MRWIQRGFFFYELVYVDSPNSSVWSFFIRFLGVLFGKTGESWETVKFAATFCNRIQENLYRIRVEDRRLAHIRTNYIPPSSNNCHDLLSHSPSYFDLKLNKSSI